MSPFYHSAVTAALLGEKIVQFVGKRGRHRAIPSLLELQTVCRQAHCTLSELECYARAQESPPAMIICGGDQQWVSDVAQTLGVAIEPDVSPQAPIIWSWRPSPVKRTVIHYGKTEREVSRNTLAAFLSGQIKAEDIIHIDQTVASETRRVIIWIPFPGLLDEFMDRPVFVEALLCHDAAVVTEESSSTTLLESLKSLGQKLWITPVSEIEFHDSRVELLEQIATIVDAEDDSEEVREVAKWNWLAQRTLSQIDERRRIYQTSLDRHHARIRASRQTLEQYRRNWMNGLHNLVEEYLLIRQNGPAMAAFWETQKKGPDLESYLTALNPAALTTKLGEFSTDRMGELVNGLNAVANKAELHRVSLVEGSAQWNPRALTAKIEAMLVEKRCFPEGGGRRSGIVGNLTGKKSAVVDERKGQVARASRVVAGLIESDFSSWSESYLKTLGDHIALQLIAALANAGLPDPDGIKTALFGLEKLHQMITSSGARVEPETLAAEWLHSLTGRRWLTRFASS